MRQPVLSHVGGGRRWFARWQWSVEGARSSAMAARWPTSPRWCQSFMTVLGKCPRRTSEMHRIQLVSGCCCRVGAYVDSTHSGPPSLARAAAREWRCRGAASRRRALAQCGLALGDKWTPAGSCNVRQGVSPRVRPVERGVGGEWPRWCSGCSLSRIEAPDQRLPSAPTQTVLQARPSWQAPQERQVDSSLPACLAAPDNTTPRPDRRQRHPTRALMTPV
ncbi:hypothetical protein PSPO01_01111 [Paraphaeosphaeria sporulosa]